jgi:predicted ATPase
MKRYILTGAPGCGKTTLIRALTALGHAVVEEAATDVIAAQHARGIDEPWRSPAFIDAIVAVQAERQRAADGPGDVQFHDRSAVCTYALSLHLGFPISPALEAEMARLESGRVFERTVFFIDNLGFVEPTAARRISFEDSLAFEKTHEETYRAFGYECVRIAPWEVSERTEAILRLVRALRFP